MEVKIFWCRFNKYYAQKWANFLQWKKWILIASCAVTDQAKRKFIKEVKKNVKEWKKVYLTWCWAFYKDGEVDEAWFYNTYKDLLPYKENIILLSQEPSDDKKVYLNLYTKAFVIVQLGCDSHCTFCITVKKRWKHKNRPLKEVIEEINYLHKKWINEVVLTWINLAAWWMDSTNVYPNNHFPKFLKEILNNTDIPRIRISSIWPEFVCDSWYEVLENNRILPYFHLSIQSWSDKILKSMGRHYTASKVFQIIENLKKLKKDVPVNIGADIIVWFPWETEDDFNQTLQLAKHITKLHVFPFSPHLIWDTVPASKFPNQIDNNTKELRKKKLIQLCDENYKNLAKSTKWLKVQVLVETNNTWWTQNYLKAKVSQNAQLWEIVEMIF